MVERVAETTITSNGYGEGGHAFSSRFLGNIPLAPEPVINTGFEHFRKSDGTMTWFVAGTNTPETALTAGPRFFSQSVTPTPPLSIGERSVLIREYASQRELHDLMDARTADVELVRIR